MGGCTSSANERKQGINFEEGNIENEGSSKKEELIWLKRFFFEKISCILYTVAKLFVAITYFFYTIYSISASPSVEHICWKICDCNLTIRLSVRFEKNNSVEILRKVSRMNSNHLTKIAFFEKRKLFLQKNRGKKISPISVSATLKYQSRLFSSSFPPSSLSPVKTFIE